MNDPGAEAAFYAFVEDLQWGWMADHFATVYVIVGRQADFDPQWQHDAAMAVMAIEAQAR